MKNIEYKEAYTPGILVKEDKLLNIPIYQRLFVWEEEQINQLLKDLSEAFDKAQGSPYYIGIITVVEKNGQWDIVDGQQRLTFLSLFGAYCCSKDQTSQWRNFLYAKNNELRINYVGRSEDREELKKIATGKSDVVNRNFNIFNDCMKKNFGKIDTERFQLFSRWIYQYASFLITELPMNYAPEDLNLFFEKMNATGKQLTAVEQLKGKSFPASAAIFDAVLNFDKKFLDTKTNDANQKIALEEILNDFQINVVPENENKFSDISSRSILTPEVFLLHCLEILGQNNVLRDERKILETFETYVGSDVTGKISPADFLKVMKKYRTWIDENIIYLKESSDGSWEYAFRRDEEQMDEDASDNDKKMKQFQSMLYVSSSNYQEWVLDAYLDCKNNQERQFGLSLLQEHDSARNRNILVTQAMKYPEINRYCFWKLDYLLWEKFIDDETNFCKQYGLEESDKESKEAIRNYKFRRNRSIEHLHPQADGEITEWEKAKHHFGNLAMISSSFNSTQQNDSVGIKFKRLEETQLRYKKLESIKLLLMFKLAKGQEMGWTVTVMQRHEKEMLDLLQLKMCGQ